MDGKEIGGCCSRDSALGMDGEDGRRRNGGREGEVECGIHLQAEDSRDLGRRRTWEGVYALTTHEVESLVRSSASPLPKNKQSRRLLYVTASLCVMIGRRSTARHRINGRRRRHLSRRMVGDRR